MALSQNKTSSGRISFLLLSGGFNFSPDPRQSMHFRPVFRDRRSTRRKPSVDNCQHRGTMVGGKATGPYLAQGLLWPWGNYAYRARVCMRAALEPFPHGQETAPE